MDLIYVFAAIASIAFVSWIVKWRLHYNDTRIIRRDAEPKKDPDVVVHVMLAFKRGVVSASPDLSE